MEPANKPPVKRRFRFWNGLGGRGRTVVEYLPDGDVIERQLAHIERNEVRAAYHRSTYLEARAALMSWWADYLDGRKGGKVGKMPKRTA